VKLSVIVAVSSNHVIGYQNRLPWHLPADLKHFKKITMGHPIIMGRKTFESIGKPLPGRTNIIITRKTGYEVPGCIVVNSVEEAVNLCRLEEEVFIIGGAEIILQVQETVDRIYLTRIHQEFDGDTFFPEPDPSHWTETSREEFSPEGKNEYSYSFIVLDRKAAADS
jgi:dihydrofolate reductase